MRKNKLLIVDDIFPSVFSPFRYEEFTEILSSIPDSIVVTTGHALPHVAPDAKLADIIGEYEELHPEFCGRILADSVNSVLERMQFRLAYFMFLNNTYSYVSLMEKYAIPFVFTLYPGGGFSINNMESDKKLTRIFRSPCFRGVIVNEQLTKNYLLSKKLCAADEILYIPGVVVPHEQIQQACLQDKCVRNHYSVSFCAYKYSAMGADKGYDIFVEVAKKLHRQGLSCEFHVIGNFDQTDIDVSELGDSIHFHGILTSNEMRAVFSQTDIMLNPVRANVLTQGSFNGFPTTSCVTAALCGALVMSSDPLNQNCIFKSGCDIEIIEAEANSICEKINYYFNRPTEMQKLRKQQLEKFVDIYGYEAQMKPRLQLLWDEIEWSRYNPLNKTYGMPIDRIEIPIMHCFDNNYVIPAMASFHSMLKYADTNHNYKLFVLHSDITVQNQKLLSDVVHKFPNAELEFINMSNRFDDIWQGLKFSGHYSKEVLYKLLIASIFPQYDKIIVTDVDVVFSGDIAPSYFSLEPDESICFAGVHQINPKGSFLEPYYEGYKDNFDENALSQLKICGGYLVANLKYIREHNKEATFVSYLAENLYRLRQSEQDVINFCCTESEIRYLPLHNVLCTYTYDIFGDDPYSHEDPFYTPCQIQDAMQNPVQVHYATSTKPWKDTSSTKADLWLFNLIESGGYYEFIHKTNGMQTASPVVVEPSTVGSNWKPNNSPIVVSVLCCTYNHSHFIRKVLDGIVNQRVDFKFEVIVADDASTDNTRAVIEEYSAMYPNLFRCILREKNVGIGKNYYDALMHVQGKYLAICDGDDYWVDMDKLQRQVDFMENNPSCNVCCTSFMRHEHGENGITESPFDVNAYIQTMMPLKDSYTFEDLLYCRFIASCTTMLRWQFKGRVPEFLAHYSVIDFPLSLLHAASGSICVMNDYYPSIYNVHSKGITSTDSVATLVNTYDYLLNELDQYLIYRFTNTINEYKNFLKTGICKFSPAPNPEQNHFKALCKRLAPMWVRRIYRKLKSIFR